MSSEKIETQNNDTTSIEILDDKDDIRELKGNMQELEDEIENHEKSIYRILKEIPEKDDLWNEIEYHKKSIYRIFVPQYMNDTSSNDDYVVTYSYDHDSFLGWPINIDEKNKLNELQPDVYVKLVPLNNLLPYLDDFVLLSKKIMSLYLYRKHWLIDFNNDRTGDTGFLELENTVNCVDSDNGHDGRDTIGFLPNGDLIQVSLINKKIYKYCLENKPKNKGSWKCSQIYDLKIPKSLRGQYTTLRSSICQEKLFLIVNDHKTLIIQIDLSNMTFERQYISEGFILDVFLCNSDGASFYRKPIIMNKNQTLFAIADDYTYIFSMENGMLILKYNYGEENSPVEFISLEDNSERLVINQHFSLEHKLLDPYQPYYEIDISQDFNKKSVITKSNKKICIDKNGNVCIKNGLELKQLTNKNIYRNSIYYTLFTFKVIQNMLDDIIKQVEIKKVASSKEFVLKHNFKINNEGLCQLYLRNNFNSVTDNVIPNIDYYNDEITLRKSTGKEIKYIKVPHILSYELLNDQNLVLINMRGIDIYSINEFGLKHQYFWHNDEWDRIYKKFIKDHGNKFNASFIDKYYKPLFINVYNSEFNDSKYLIPLSRLNCNDAKEIIEDFINDTVALSRFGLEMLKMAISDKIDYQLIKQLATGIIDNEMAISKFGTEILNIAFKENYHDVVYQTIDKIIKSTQDYSETYMTFISLFLKNLCEYYPDSIVKYILSTSIILSPYCNKIKNSKNTSLYSYSKNIYVKESNMDNNYFKIILSFLKELWIREETQTVSFIVPFPRICEYNDNPWNKFIYEPKSILFCNIDGDHLYNWWNFAAIVDYKWKTFGWIYYYLNWFFYTIFYICYSLASALDQNSIPDSYFKLLFIISIVLGSIFLIFEIRQFLWNTKLYVNDVWNLFDIGSYLLPIITAILWFINKSLPSWLTAISIILISFKFLLFFRVIKSFGIYFAIIIGVAKKVFPFLMLLFFIILGYAQAFFIILKSTNENDDNDPQNLATKYDFINSDGTINNTTKLIQETDSNTNLFNWFPTSLLAVYYDVPVTKVRKLINAINNDKAVFDYPPFISKKLEELVVLTNDNKKQNNEEHDDEGNKNNKLVEQKEPTKEELIQQNNLLKKQITDINDLVTEVRKLINAIDNNKKQSNEKHVNKEKQYNKPEKQIEQTNEDLTQQNNVPNQQTDDLDPFSTDEFNPFNLIKKIEGKQSLPPTIIDSVKKLAVEEQNKRLSEKQIEQTNEDLIQQNNKDLTQQNNVPNQQTDDFDPFSTDEFNPFNLIKKIEGQQSLPPTIIDNLIQQNNEDLIQQNNEDLIQQNNVPNQQTDDFDPFSTDEFNPFNLTKKIESEQSLFPTIIDSVKKLAIEEQNKRLKEKK
ncbi:116_t:CDS:2 [Rhizophagus irregularis]|nr:116_t:CDS:2 [Rhizophagus irregularis]